MNRDWNVYSMHWFYYYVILVPFFNFVFYKISDFIRLIGVVALTKMKNIEDNKKNKTFMRKTYCSRNKTNISTSRQKYDIILKSAWVLSLKNIF